MDILQSCLLTLVACIYTALHLNVPEKTAWYQILWSKTQWVALTLFAPEIVLYMAADQLQRAWALRRKLRDLQNRSDTVDKYVSVIPFLQWILMNFLLTWNPMGRCVISRIPFGSAA